MATARKKEKRPDPHRVNLNPLTNLTLLGAFLYATGFVVANVHFARYEVIRLSLLQTRYLGAAALFSFVCLPTLLAGLAFNKRFRELAPDARRRASTIELPIGITVSFVYGMGVAQIPGLVVGDPHLSRWAWSTLLAYEIGRYAPWNPLVPSTGGTASSLSGTMALTFASLLAFAGFFGYQVYPYVNPAFGGGAVWHGELLLSQPAATTGAVVPRAAIIDRDSEIVNAVVCSQTAAEPPQAVSYPAGAIARISLVGLAALPDFQSRVCSSADGPNRNANDRSPNSAAPADQKAPLPGR